MKIKTSGFTLIELLVVIAIIGILSAVILGSLNTARSKGNDSSIKSNLDNARAQAELFYDSNGNQYNITPGSTTDVCSATGIAGGTKGIYQFAGGAASVSGATINNNILTAGSNTGVVTCHATPLTGSYAPFNAWAMEAPLKGTYAGYTHPVWCVDSSGIATTTEGSTLANGDAACK